MVDFSGVTTKLGGVIKEEATEAAKKAALLAFLAGAVEYDKTKFKTDEQAETLARNAAIADYKLSAQGTLVKAKLIPRTGENAPKIDFMFNPSELTFSRDISLTNLEGARTLQGLPKVSFGYVEPYSVQLAGIVFDTYETGTNVLELIKPIRAAMEFANFTAVNSLPGVQYDQNGKVKNAAEIATYIGKNITRGSLAGIPAAGMEYDDYNMKRPLTTKRPPVYYFMWGEQNYLQCFIQKLNYKLTMFLPDGTPVRAVVDLSLQEVDMTTVARELSAPQRPTA